MAGGNWITQNKVRAGVYINFKGIPTIISALGERGTLAVVAPIGWHGSNISIVNSADLTSRSVELFGSTIDDPILAPYRLAASYVNKFVFVSPATTSTRASRVIGGNLTATSLNTGARGNAISIGIVANPDAPGTFIVTTYLDGIPFATSQAATANAVESNAIVTFSGTGSLVASAITPLTGGTTVAPTATDFTNALESIQTTDFDVLAVPTLLSGVPAIVAAYTNRNFNEEGKYFQSVVPNSPTIDSELVISVRNGFIDEQNNIIDELGASVVFGAMSAGANVNESNTFARVRGASEPYPRLTSTEIISALEQGQIVFDFSSGLVRVEQDVNTLKTLGQDRNRGFQKNRVIRVIQAINNDLKNRLETNYIGKVNANADGYGLVKSEVVSYLNTLQGIGAIQDFDGQTDVTVTRGEQLDSILVTIYIRPVDSIEKIYMTVEVA